MLGAGKYDELCTHCRVGSNAKGVVVIIIEGIKGSGFSVQGPPELTLMLPGLLENMAAQLRRDLGVPR